MASAFDYIKKLGEGWFGEVWHAIDESLGCEVAVKCIPRSQIANQANHFQEAQALKAAEHPNIVRVNEAGEFTDDSIYVSMEYLSRGSVEDERQGDGLSLSRSRTVMIDVLRGLSHAHQNSVIHRDIKPANILIGDSGEAKLSDFGLAVVLSSTFESSSQGSFQYLLHVAPEALSTGNHTFLSDVYGCGVTFYRLVNGDHFLPTVNNDELLASITQGTFPRRERYREYVPTSFRQLINKAMNVNPEERFQSADEMRRALEKLHVKVDWIEHDDGDGLVWLGESESGKMFQVALLPEDNNFWTVECRVGSGDKLRRVTADCKKQLPFEQASKQARAVLQRITTQGK